MDRIERLLQRRARRIRRDRIAKLDETLAMAELSPDDEVVVYRDPETNTYVLWDPRRRTMEASYG